MFGASRVIADVAGELELIPRSRHVVLTGDGTSRKALVTTDLVDEAVDQAMERLGRLGLPSDDVVLVRLDAIGQAAARRPLASVVWADLPKRRSTKLSRKPGALWKRGNRRRLRLLVSLLDARLWAESSPAARPNSGEAGGGGS